MKYLRKNIILYYLLLAIGLAFSSCKDDNENYSLYETVWIHQFKPEDNIMDGVDAVALVFGKRSFEYYSLDNNKKVIKFLGTYNYIIKDEQIIIGEYKNDLDSNHIFFFEKVFYRSSKTPGDIFP